MRYTVYSICVVLLSAAAMAGIATMDFNSSVGLFTFQSGPGSLIASGGRAAFTGQNTSLLAQGDTPVSSGGTVSATMTLRPSTDAVNLVGIVMVADEGVLQAVCDGSGYVTLSDYIGQMRTASFPYPGAYDNYFTLTYNASMGRATLTLNGSSTVFIENALDGAMTVQVGVGSDGPGGFESFSATGSGIPAYPPADTDGDGVSDAEELAAGTDPDDPGSRPILYGLSATVTGLNGTSVAFGSYSFEEPSVNVSIATPESIPPGSVPGGKTLSSAGTELTANGTFQLNPVTVTMPYTAAQIPYLDPATLTPFFYSAGSYSAAGIDNISVNTTARTVSFTTTHFSIFVLAGDPLDSDSDGTPDIDDAFPFNLNGQTDADSDGLGDEWEMDSFGNLTTADDTTDYDSDGVSDLQEFEAWYFNFDPTDGVSTLPVAGPAACIAIAALILAAARRYRLK